MIPTRLGSFTELNERDADELGMHLLFVCHMPWLEPGKLLVDVAAAEDRELVVQHADARPLRSSHTRVRNSRKAPPRRSVQIGTDAVRACRGRRVERKSSDIVQDLGFSLDLVGVPSGPWRAELVGKWLAGTRQGLTEVGILS
jgi:hypothetical protein